ncbi:YCF48-related protein [Sulfurimonas sp. HSL-1656]|uniref:WD40/YVTN/BNR-like repeat-containing protein n=1 Tax=Thiomicrolovo subterrani TaxID=3131934 RepID=UPI0031FA219D
MRFNTLFRGGFGLLFAVAVIFTGCGSSSDGRDRDVVWAVGNADSNGYAALYRSDDGGTHWYRPDANATMLEGFDAQNLHVTAVDDVWVVGTVQTLVHTDDGGQTWAKYATFPDENSSIDLYGISALSPDEFWVSGSNGSVYHTKDGARHWEKMDPAAFHNGLVQGIKAIDALTIYAVGKPADSTGGFVSRSLDGGENWEAITLPDNYNANEWIGVKATDKDHIVVYGGRGHYSATADGGTTWINGLINVSGGVDGADINDLIMLDTVRWWSAMDLDNIFLTTDAGVHWNEQNSSGASNMFLVGIDAADAQHAVIAGMAAGSPQIGKLLLTRDGGTSWTQQLLTEMPMQKVMFAPAEDVNATEEEGGSMFASIIRTSVEGFVGGATGDIGGVVMGLILEKIGWGSQGDDEANKLLQSMNAKLDDILNDLQAIKESLDSLKVQLNLDMEIINKNILDPTDAITDIGTTHDEFDATFGGVKSGEGNQTEIHAFIDNHIVNDFHIENDVNTIHDAIVPPDIAKTPALTNFTNFVNDSYTQGYGTLTDAYKAMELYTSQLIVNQLKGVNLVVEAKHVEEGNASVTQYMGSYQTKLHEMLGDPGNGESFIYNAYRLALMHANPLPYQSGDDYFTDEAAALLKRAEFYRLLASGSKTFGPRILVFQTQDTPSDNSFYIANPDTILKNSQFGCVQADGSVPGATYVYWDGNSIKPETAYDVYECGITDPIEPRTYDILDQNPNPYIIALSTAKTIGQITVQRYDENYSVQPDGNYTYGHTTFFRRSALNHFAQDSEYWSAHTDGMYLSDTYGSAPWGTGILGQADGEYEYTGHYEIDGSFRYDGTQERTLYVDYDATYHMVTNSYYTGAGSSEAHAYVHFGVWDATAGQAATVFHSHHQDTVGDTKDTLQHPTGVAHFTAKPGHSYYVYFSMHVSGISGMPDDGTHSRVYLEEINYIYLHF